MKKVQTNNNVIKFFKSQNMILLIFLVMIFFLIGYSRHIIKNERLYTIEVNSKQSKDKKILFEDGIIIINYKTHYFLAPQIKYNGANVSLKSYKAGYYIGKQKIYELKNNKGKNNFDLKSVLENENFNVYEPSKNAVIFSEKNLKNIEKMTFKLNGVTTSGKKYSLIIPLVISEI